MNVRNTLPPTLIALALAACATAQENPNYQHSTTYNGASPYTQVATSTPYTATTATTQNATYQTRSAPIVYDAQPGYSSVTSQPVYQNAGYQASSQYSTAPQTRVNHECLSKEMNRQLIGGALGGTAGAFAGKELIGGTKGTVAGALVGGVAGYGIGDKSINCDPVPVASYPTQMSTTPTTYYPATSYPATTEYVPTQVVSQATLPAPTIAAPSTDTYYGDTTGTPGYEALQQAQSTQVSPSAYSSVPATTTSASSQYSYPSTGFGASTHTVVQNDTVYSLSRKLCSSVDEIQAMNGIDRNFGIKIGQNLKLPASKC